MDLFIIKLLKALFTTCTSKYVPCKVFFGRKSQYLWHPTPPLNYLYIDMNELINWIGVINFMIFFLPRSQTVINSPLKSLAILSIIVSQQASFTSLQISIWTLKSKYLKMWFKKYLGSLSSTTCGPCNPIINGGLKRT